MYRVMLRDAPEDVPITITGQPEDLLVTSGEKVTFTITAEGSGLSYVWYYRKTTASAWSAWPQKDSNELTVTSNDTWAGMQVYCLITDEDGNTLASSVCVITLSGGSAASITDQTDKVTAAAGDEVTLFVDADAGVTYQWYYAMDGDTSWTKWSGYTSASIAVTMQSGWDGMRAYCLIASSTGYTTSDAISFTLAATVIHEPSTDPAEPHLYSCTLTEGAPGEIDSVEFTILPNNPGYELLASRTTLVEIYDTKKGKSAFSGRVLTVTPEMQDSGLVFKSVVCESQLGYLCDSIQPYAEEATYTLEEFFKFLLVNHNAQVEGYKKIYPGTITATASASTGNVTKGLNYQTTWEALSDKLLSTEGGEIRLRETDGVRYLDYVDELGDQIDTVAIELGVNMRSIAREIDPTSVVTRLIPLGAKLEDSDGNDTEERLTIASVNGGSLYLDDEKSQETYGIVVGTVTWDDVTVADNLLTKGTQWLQQQSVADKITLTAYDLSLIGLASDAIERYNYYQVINSAIGTNRYFRVVKRTVDICNPANITYEMGERSRSLGATIISTQKQAESEADERAAAIERLANKLASSSGLYMTTEEQDDGSYIYYMHNKPTLAESDIVWKLTAEAFGISLDGGQTYPYGFTVTGEMVMALIYAEGISADYINSGTLTVTDSSGNIMFSANVDTGEVTINAASLTIKGTPSLLSATTYYALSSSAEALDDDVNWTQDKPTRTSGTYIWSKTVYVYSDNTKTETTPVCISGLDGADGTGIASTSVTYQVSANGTTPPTGDWSSSIPPVSQGEYLWTRTVWTYTDGATETMYSVSYTGEDGADGTSVNILGTAYTAESEYTAGKTYTLYSDSGLTTKIAGAEAGDSYLVNGYLFVYSETDGAFVCTGVIRGEDGTGITSVVNYYLASPESSGVTTDTAGWTTSVQTVDATNKYLWNYEATTLTDGNTDITTPCIIGIYSEDGIGIEDVIEYYAVSTSNSAAPSSWSTSVQTMDVVNRYLWNYEKIVYTNGTTKETDPCVIGVYGDTGEAATTYYTWIKYADDENGAGMSDEPEDKAYIGLAYNQTTKTESTDPTDYTWSKIMGENGVDGTTYYTWIKYADDENGAGLTDDPTGKYYIGLAYNKDTPEESEDAADYIWSLFRGADGVDGTNGTDGRGISSAAVTYQVSTSGTTTPTGTWSTSVPTVPQGSYLWVRTIFTYTDGSTATMYSVSYYGADGNDGDDGDDGTGIKSITNYYLATSKTSGVTTSTSGWTTTVQTVDATNKYLWNYEIVALTDGNSDITTPIIIGMYSEDGADGVGIASVTEYYAVSTSASTAPTSWSTTVQTMDSTNKYLWNYEVITYTDGSTHSTDKRVIGVYGDTGEAGEDGEDGEDGQMLYATCTSAESAVVKVATLSSGTISSLKSGVTVAVTFEHANTANLPALNVGGTGSKAITVYGSPLTGTSVYNWVAGSTVQFVYDGTYWVMTETSALYAVGQWCYDNDTTYIDGGTIAAGTIAASSIVAGSITATQIASGAITADKIDVTDLFAQDITATGTIRGVTLEAATGTFTGTVTTTSGSSTAKLTSGSLQLYYDDVTQATFSTTQWAGTDYTGVRVGIGVDASFISFSRRSSDSGTYQSTYYIDFDGSIAGYVHNFYGTENHGGAATFSSKMYVTGTASFSSYVYLANNATLYGTTTSGSNLTLIGLNSYDEVVVGSPGTTSESAPPLYLRGETITAQADFTVKGDLYQTGNTYINDLQAYHVVSVKSVTLSSTTSAADGSTWTASGTCTAPKTYTGAIALPQRANYGYPSTVPVIAVSGTTATVTCTYRNASDGSHTLAASIIVIFYI